MSEVPEEKKSCWVKLGWKLQALVALVFLLLTIGVGVFLMLVPVDDSVLILYNGKIARNAGRPLLMSLEGSLSPIRFSIPNGTDIFTSCAVMFRNKIYVYGGQKPRPREISMVDDCSLESYGELSFDFYTGACTSTEELVILCFDYDDPKQLGFDLKFSSVKSIVRNLKSATFPNIQVVNFTVMGCRNFLTDKQESLHQKVLKCL